MNMIPRRQMTNEGPTDEEVRIIGVELAMQDPTGREVELDMFATQHTIHNPYLTSSHRQRARITLHTSNGDITVRFPFYPGGQYQLY